MASHTRRAVVGKRSVGQKRIPSSMDPPEGWKLSVEEATFVGHLLGGAPNPTEAARLTGYKHPTVAACGLMDRPSVQAAIAAKFDQAGINAVELVAREAEIVRSSYEDCLSKVAGRWEFDLNKIRNAGKMHLVKRVRSTKYGLEIEMEDKAVARATLARFLGLNKDTYTVINEFNFKSLPDTREATELLTSYTQKEIDYDQFVARARQLMAPAQPQPVVILSEANVPVTATEPESADPYPGDSEGD